MRKIQLIELGGKPTLIEVNPADGTVREAVGKAVGKDLRTFFLFTEDSGEMKEVEGWRDIPSKEPATIILVRYLEGG